MSEGTYILEYELINITFGQPYELPENDVAWSVCEEDKHTRSNDTTFNKPNENSFVYDADGIPMGDSLEERLMRREQIHQFIQTWRAEHSDNPRVFNINLQEYIKVNQVFLLESVLHSSIRYQSTKAIMNMEEVMAYAEKIDEMVVKEGNSNQKPFKNMIVMRYNSNELGEVKSTVGVRKRTLEKVQYGITVPSPEVPFIDNSMRSKKRKKPKNKKKRPIRNA